MNEEMQLNKKTHYMIWLLTIHTSLLIASNAGGAKMIAVVGDFAASATVFSYAITFVICDIINEIYGKRVARLAVNIGLGGLVISVLFFKISIAAPAATFWEGQDAYVATLGLGGRLLAGGWISYVVSNHIDVYLFHLIKKVTGDKYFWLRKNGSTAISQLIDTCIFMTIAFYGVFPLANAIPGQYLMKFAVAFVCTPLSYVALKMIRNASQPKTTE